MLYSLARPLLFRLEPERAHELVMGGLSRVSRRPLALNRLARRFCLEDERLGVSRFGLHFPNPVGLAAGMDKNAIAVPAWQALGFGAVEVGSVTALAQPGNPRPRLFRLPEDDALINRMGFNNDGAGSVAARLARVREAGAITVPLGVNLGKSKRTPLEEAAEDYRRSLGLLWPYADYFVVNVSSPNTPGLRELQAREQLDALLAALQAYARERERAEPPQRPLLLKIAPDLSWEGLDDVVALAKEHELAGLIATNTTLSREGLKSAVRQEAGGLSGRPLAGRALEVLRYLRARVGGRLALISVGGIFTAEDAYARLRAGASLVQLYTGLIYRGPTLAREINLGLLALLERDGLRCVEAAAGLEA